MLDKALALAKGGWPIFPLVPGEKRPACAHGLHDATTDPEQIRQWWGHNPDYGIGCATGEALECWVLDEDEPGVCPDYETTTVRTPSGGRHFYFKWDPNRPIRNRAKVIPGCDIRGEGGYTILPPTPGYEWIDTRDPSPAPDELYDQILAKKTSPRKPAMIDVEPMDVEWESTSPSTTRYGAAAVKGELAKIASSEPGRRRDTLNVAAFNLGQLYGGKVIEDVREQMMAAAPICEDFTESEARTTIENGWADGISQPRAKPDPKVGNVRVVTTSGNESLIDDVDVEPEPEIIHPCTDLANADRFRNRYQGKVKWTHALGWMHWDGKRWKRDEENEVMGLMQSAIMGIKTEADAAVDEDKKASVALFRWYVQSQSTNRVQAALVQAAALHPLVAHIDNFDKSPWDLNCENGVVNLNSGRIERHNQSSLHTMVTNVEFDKGAKCPEWDKFLIRVLPDEKMRSFIQRFAGYSLSGSISEQCFAFLWGGGENGKSVLMEVLARILGTYATVTPFDTFVRRGAGQSTNDIARLRGARMVRASEPDEGVRLSESIIKQATGGEPMAARFLRKEFFEFHPQFKLWFGGNHEPGIKGSDHGIWRRVLKVPFLVKIPASERRPFDELVGDLLEEGSGILNWAIQGFQDWMLDGMRPPRDVIEATKEYRKSEDPFGTFCEERCEENPTGFTTIEHLWQAYKKWAADAGEEMGTKRGMSAKFRDRGFSVTRKRDKRGYAGINLKAGRIAEAQPEYEGDKQWATE